MTNTYVVAPNFSMAPPPRLYRPDEPPPSPPPANTTPVEPFSPLVELQLGDVLTLPFGAEMVAVNSMGRVAIDPDDLYTTMTEKGFREPRGVLFSGRLGLWASLFAALGVGPAVNVSIFLESRSSDILEVAELQTRRFRVTDEYVKKLLESEAVVAHLKQHPTSHVYMVSGMKVAKGAKGESRDSFKAGADAGGDVGSDVADMKLFQFLWRRWKRTSFKSRSDFVLAVQLRHIELGKKKGDPAVVTLSEENATMAGRQNASHDAAQYEAEKIDDSLDVATKRFGKRLVKSWKDGSSDESCVLSLMEEAGDKEEFENLTQAG